jgi:hypothetical protein
VGQTCLAGVCSISAQRCDFDTAACPAGGPAVETCQPGRGRPKYGDYNGIGCGGDRVVSAWASATAPPGVPTTGAIQIFADTLTLPTQLTTSLKLTPAGDTGTFNLLVNGAVKLADTAGGVWNASVTAGTYTISVTAQPPTLLGAYSVSFGDDCSPNGTVQVFRASSKVCTVSVKRNAFFACTETCATERETCKVNATSNEEKAQCFRDFDECVDGCSIGKLTITKILVPATDPGRFQLRVDGTIQAPSVGNGGQTATLKLAPNKTYTVSETAAGGTNLANYTSVIGGQCAADGKVTLQHGDEKTCIITNYATPKLTIVSQLLPSSDPGLFNLRIDGVVKATNVGHNGSSGAQMVSPGSHIVSETAGAGTSLSNYTVSFSGACNATGVVTLAAGDTKTCTITAQRKGPGCLSMCTSQNTACKTGCTNARNQCQQATSDPDGPLGKECVQEFNMCNQGCAADLAACTQKC